MKPSIENCYKQVWNTSNFVVNLGRCALKLDVSRCWVRLTELVIAYLSWKYLCVCSYVNGYLIISFLHK